MSGSITAGPPQGIPGGGVPPGMIPGAGGPPGGPPPGAAPGQAPPGNLGPVTVPQGNPGNIMQAAQKLAAAHKMIMEALPALPLGTPLHESVMKIATDLGKNLTKAGQDAQMTIQTLMQAMRGVRNDSQMSAVARMQGQAPPGGPPATPPPAPPGGPMH